MWSKYLDVLLGHEPGREVSAEDSKAANDEGAAPVASPSPPAAPSREEKGHSLDPADEARETPRATPTEAASMEEPPKKKKTTCRRTADTVERRPWTRMRAVTGFFFISSSNEEEESTPLPRTAKALKKASQGIWASLFFNFVPFVSFFCCLIYDHNYAPSFVLQLRCPPPRRRLPRVKA